MSKSCSPSNKGHYHDLTFKKMALPVAIAEIVLFVSGFASTATPVVGYINGRPRLQTANAAQYRNIDLDALQEDEVLFEHESNMFWGKGEYVSKCFQTGDSLAFTEESDHVPNLTKHGRKMDPAIIKVDDNVYLDLASESEHSSHDRR
ncbi:hypothetical protein O9929_19530 [Vibrio lentus]|nr:hypothetical protein [Vibrio lentus]